MTTNVALLPEKWRMELNRLSSMLDTIPDGPIKAAMKSEIDRAREDANELEAALATQPKDGELLALSRRLANQANCEGPPVDDLLMEAATAFRTLAASPRGVDDAMVERACRGICAANGWDADAPVRYSGTKLLARNPGGSTVPQWRMHEHDMRAALTAALSQPSGEDG